jgi:AcrR family transcriptional regulator
VSDVQAPRRRTKGAARERLIVNAAADAIAEQGLAHVTVSDIARRAGIGVGHVSYYFPSKADLLMRAITQSEEQLHASMAVEIAELNDPWQRLGRIFDLSRSSGRGDSGWVLWLEVWSRAAQDPHVARLQAKLDSRWRATLSDVIRDGCATGAFATDDPELVSMLLSCLLDGLSVHMTLGDAQLSESRQRQIFIRAAQAHLSIR